MKQFVNKDKVIQAFVVEPYKNDGEPWDMGNTHNWQAKLIMGYFENGYPIEICIEVNSELEAIDIINGIGLHQLP